MWRRSATRRSIDFFTVVPPSVPLTPRGTTMDTPPVFASCSCLIEFEVSSTHHSFIARLLPMRFLHNIPLTGGNLDQHGLEPSVVDATDLVIALLVGQNDLPRIFIAEGAIVVRMPESSELNSGRFPT
ncbi:hypothetical protein PMIN07_011502 [Paraphaeosphaeria minitans]